MRRIVYNGKSKVIIRLCELYNELAFKAVLLKEIYDKNDNGIVDDSEKVNGHNVYKDVPADAQFTDTVYDDREIRDTVTTNTRDINTIFEILTGGLGVYSYLVDHEGNYIVDHEGNRILIVQYENILMNLQEAVAELQSRKYVYWAEAQSDDNG